MPDNCYDYGRETVNFSFTPEEEKFRDEVREFFKGEEKLSEEVMAEVESGEGFGPATWAILRKIGKKGWLCPTWPQEYGGLDLPFICRYIIMEEMHHYLDLYGTVGAGMAGPIILMQGSEGQKKNFLLPIARGEIEFVLGYTEPEAGSDLASLIISAEDQGDHFIINGQKVFNTRAHYAQYHWLGARTKEIKPDYKGISLFIVDLKTPGITITPYHTIGGTRTNGVFYDNVKVPKESLVGEKNRGFYYILDALAYERVLTVAAMERDFKSLIDYINNIGRGNDPVVRQKVAELAIDIEAARLFVLKVVWMLENKMIPSHEAALLKIQITETEQRLVNTAMQVLGPYGQLKRGSKWSQLNGRLEWRYRDSIEALIVRGTSEIMRNIIAERGLGLPRG